MIVSVCVYASMCVFADPVSPSDLHLPLSVCVCVCVCVCVRVCVYGHGHAYMHLNLHGIIHLKRKSPGLPLFTNSSAIRTGQDFPSLYALSDSPYRPLKNKSRLRGFGSLGQMSMGDNAGFMNDRT